MTELTQNLRFLALKTVGVLNINRQTSISIHRHSQQNELLVFSNHDAILSISRASHDNHLEGLTVRMFDERELRSDNELNPLIGSALSLSLTPNERLFTAVLSSDDSILLAVTVLPNSQYAAKIFLADGMTYLGSMNIGLHSPYCIKPNPCSNSFAVCLTDGSLQIWNFENQKLFTSLNKQLNARSVTWSPKGKQLMIGTNDGRIIQITPTGDPKRMVAQDQLTTAVLEIVWTSTYHIICAFDSGPDVTFFSVHLHKDPNVTPNFKELPDVLMSSFDVDPNVPLTVFTKFIPEWKIIVCASSKSSDIGVLASEGDTENWVNCILDENSRAQLPIPMGSDKDPLCVGLGISFCSQRKIDTGPDPSSSKTWPLLFALTCFGDLHAFSVVFSRGNIPPLTKVSQPFSKLTLKPSDNSPKTDHSTSVLPTVPISSDNAAIGQQKSDKYNRHDPGKQVTPAALPSPGEKHKVSASNAAVVNEMEAEKRQEEEKGCLKGAQKLMESFRSDLQKLKLDAKIEKPIEDKGYAAIHKETQVIEKLKSQLKVQLDELIHDVQMLKSSHLHTFNIVNRAKVFHEKSQNDRYQSFLRNAPLPPELQKLSDSIQNSEGFIEMRANEILDLIESMAKREKKTTEDAEEYYAMINSVLQNNYKTIMALGQKLDDLSLKYDTKCSDETLSQSMESAIHFPRRVPLSTYDATCSLKGLDFSPNLDKGQEVSARRLNEGMRNEHVKVDSEKIGALKDFLSSRTRVPVTKLKLEPNRVDVNRPSQCKISQDNIEKATLMPKEQTLPIQSVTTPVGVVDAKGVSAKEERVKLLDQVRDRVFQSQQPPSDKDAPVVNVRDLNIGASSQLPAYSRVLNQNETPSSQSRESLQTSYPIVPRQSTPKHPTELPKDQVFVIMTPSSTAQSFFQPALKTPENSVTKSTGLTENSSFLPAVTSDKTFNVLGKVENSTPKNESSSNVSMSLFRSDSKPSFLSSMLSTNVAKDAPSIFPSQDSTKNSGNVYGQQDNTAKTGFLNLTKSSSVPSMSFLNASGKPIGGQPTSKPPVTTASIFGENNGNQIPLSALSKPLLPAATTNDSADSNKSTATVNNTHTQLFNKPKNSGLSILGTDPQPIAKTEAQSMQSIFGKSDSLENDRTIYANNSSPLVQQDAKSTDSVINFFDNKNTSVITVASTLPSQSIFSASQPVAGLLFGLPQASSSQAGFQTCGQGGTLSAIANASLASETPKETPSFSVVSQNVSASTNYTSVGTGGIFAHKTTAESSDSSTVSFSKLTEMSNSTSLFGTSTAPTSIFGNHGSTPLPVAAALPATTSVPVSSPVAPVNSEKLPIDSVNVVKPSEAPKESKEKSLFGMIISSSSSPATTTTSSTGNIFGSAQINTVTPASMPPLMLSSNSTQSGSSLFGNSATSASMVQPTKSTVFGNPQQQPPPASSLFGNQIASQASASQFNVLSSNQGVSGSVFGQTLNTPLTSASTKSLFGQQANSPFGTTPGAGAQQSNGSVFGQPLSTAKPVDNSASLFGNTTFCSLGSAPSTEAKSSNVFGTPFGSTAPASNPTSLSSPFGQTKTPGVFGTSFATSQSSTVFGAASSGSVFGQTGSTFGASSGGGSVFGKTMTSPLSAQTVGESSAFGTSSAFGGKSPFGAASSGPAFGGGAVFGSTSPKVFGSPTGGVFGSNSSTGGLPTFGSLATGMGNSGSSVFGGGMSGAATNSAFGSSGTFGGAMSGGSAFGSGGGKSFSSWR